jgi:hypothetical protein
MDGGLRELQERLQVAAADAVLRTATGLHGIEQELDDPKPGGLGQRFQSRM